MKKSISYKKEKRQENYLQKKLVSIFLVLSLFISTFSSPTLAAPIPHINYQGRLLTPSGAAVPNGTYSMSFALYTSLSGGSPVWTESRTGSQQVTVRNGLFSVMLGEVNPVTSVNFNQPLYLGITIENDSEMSPRKVLGTVPAAFEADNLDGKDGTYYLDRQNATGTQIASTISDFAATSRSLLSSSATGLSYSTSTGAFSLASGYTIPLTASTTAWQTFYTTPSTRITAGTGLAWNNNTLQASTTYFDSQYFKQGGNSFATTATLGTNDNNDLVFETNNTERMRLLTNGNLAIGTTTATQRLTVDGNLDLQSDGAIYVNGTRWFVANTASSSTYIGGLAGSSNVGNNNNFFGYQAGQNNTGSKNNIFGQYAGQNNTGADNNLIGIYAGHSNTGSNSNIIGPAAGYQNTGSFNNLFGHFAGFSNKGSDNNILGQSAGHSNTGSYNNIFGQSAGFSNTGDNNNYLGYEAGKNSTSTSYNNAFGYQAGQNNTGSNNNLLGQSAGYSNSGNNNNLFGFLAGGSLTGDHNNIFGHGAAADSTDGSNNNILGQNAGGFNSGSDNNLLGQFAGVSNTGSNNNLIGQYAGAFNKGSYNNFLGSESGSNNTGDFNNFIGMNAGYFLQATSSDIIGAQAFFGNNSPYQAINNVALGYRTGYNAQTGASNNILLGYQAADNLTTGANNIVLGYDVDLQNPAGNNQLNIGNLIYGTGIDGTGTTISSGNIGIGTTTLNDKFTVAGRVNIANINTHLKFTETDFNNKLWHIEVGGGNFRFAESGVSVPFTVEAGAGANAFYIKDGGNVGIGTNAPSRKLTVVTADDIAGSFSGRVQGENAVNNNEFVTLSQLSASSSLFTDSGSTTYLTQTSDSLAIGTTTATQRLTVDGNLDLSNNGAIYVNNKKWFVADTVLNSTYIAEGAGRNNSGSNVILLGNLAGANNNRDSVNIIGFNAGINNTGEDTNILGTYAGINNKGADNNLIGRAAGSANTGFKNNIIGYSAGGSNAGNHNNLFGTGAGYNNAGAYNNFFGENAGHDNTGSNNNFLGYEAGRNSTSTLYNNFFGYRVGFNNTGSNNNLLGVHSGYSNEGSENNIFGPNAGYNNTGSYNNLFGTGVGYNNTGSNNNLFGLYAGLSNTGSNNNFLGQYAGAYNTGSDNNFTGQFTGAYNTGSYNNFIGYHAGEYLQATTSDIIGSEAFRGSSVYQAVNNVALGYRAGYTAGTGASNNILLGYQAADNLTTGANNIVLGYDVDLQNPAGSNQLNIGNLIYGTGIDGTGTTISSGNIGIGTTTPSQKLTVVTTDDIAGSFSGRVQGANAVNNNEFVTLSQLSASSSLFTDGGTTTYLTQVGDSLAVGTTTATQTLTVDGNLDLQGDGAIYVNNKKWFAANTASSSTYIGEGAGSNDIGSNNNLYGRFTGSQNKGDDVVSIGSSAGTFNEGGVNNLIGRFAGYAFGGSRSNVIGSSAGRGATSTTAIDNNLIGTNTGYNNSGSFNNIIGQNAGYNNTGGDNNIFGRRAGYSNTGSNNNLFGFQAGENNNGGNNNFLGSSAGFDNTGDHNNFLGYEAGKNSTSTSYNNAFGYQAGENNTGSNNNLLGYQAGYDNKGTNNNIFGQYAGKYNTGNYNNLLGSHAGYNNTGSYNNFFGQYAGYQNTGSYNNSFGFSAGSTNTGSYNNFFGYETGRNLQATSSDIIGSEAFYGDDSSTYQAVNNVALGYRAGYTAQTGANNNILLGYQAADNLTTGANNIVLGYDVDLQSPAGNNQLNIGNLIYGTGIDGTGTTISSGNVGIGTNNPTDRLTVDGAISVNNSLRLRQWNSATDADIDALINGSIVGGLLESHLNAHMVVGIRGNDTNDSFSIISGGGNWASDNTYDTSIFTARADGNVGIGTSAPTEKLTVAGSGETRLLIKGDPSSGTVGVNIDSSSRVWELGVKGVNEGGSFILYDATAGQRRLTVDALGKFGIGTSAPSSKLTVAGDIRSDDGFIGNRLSVGRGEHGHYDTSGVINAYGAGRDIITIQTNDNAADRGLSFRNAGGYYMSSIFVTDIGSSQGDLVFASGASDASSAGAGLSESLRIASEGNIGIANTNPDTLLHVGSTNVTTGTNLLKLQDANSSCVFNADNGSPTCGSDKTLKKDISIIENELALITKLEPKFWRFKSENSNDPLKSGFIAQDVELVLPELVSENTWIDGTQRKFLNINGMIPYIVGAVKELYEMVTGNQEKIEVLEARIEALEANNGGSQNTNTNTSTSSGNSSQDAQTSGAETQGTASSTDTSDMSGGTDSAGDGTDTATSTDETTGTESGAGSGADSGNATSSPSTAGSDEGVSSDESGGENTEPTADADESSINEGDEQSAPPDDSGGVGGGTATSSSP